MHFSFLVGRCGPQKALFKSRAGEARRQSRVPSVESFFPFITCNDSSKEGKKERQGVNGSTSLPCARGHRGSICSTMMNRHRAFFQRSLGARKHQGWAVKWNTALAISASYRRNNPRTLLPWTHRTATDFRSPGPRRGWHTRAWYGYRRSLERRCILVP